MVAPSSASVAAGTVVSKPSGTSPVYEYVTAYFVASAAASLIVFLS